jgi:phage gp45-like
MIYNRIGKVTGREVVKNRDGGNNRLMLQVEITDSYDIQTIELRNQYGEDNNPVNGSQVLIIDIGSAFKMAIAAEDGITPSMNPGEKKIYSVSGAAIAAFINFLASGNIEINGNSDFAVRFNALNTALQTMLTSLNADIVSAGGAGSTTLDLSGAKVNTVKLP